MVALFIFSHGLMAQTWKPLFNGKDLTGWKHVGVGKRFVENGLLASSGGMGLLYWTGGKLGNCQIRVVYKMQNFNSNSGVFIRVPAEPKEEWMPVFYGYEVQIDNHPETSNEDEYHISGTLYAMTKPRRRLGGTTSRIMFDMRMIRWGTRRNLLSGMRGNFPTG
jgi:hypothetical protein